MALSRLYLAERRVLAQKQVFLIPTRSSSSSGTSMKTSNSKRGEAAKEKKAIAVQSFVEKYMLMNPGVFPKTKQVQNELGGSWYLLKDILAELKEKMANDPHVYNQITVEADVTVEAASEAAVTEVNADGAKVNDPENTVLPLDLHIQKNTVSREKSHVSLWKDAEVLVTKDGINPGVFPKTKQVQNELGGSRYFLKDILTAWKEKMANDPHVYKQITVEAASKAAVTEVNADGAKVNDPENTVLPLDLHIQKNTVRREKSHVSVEKAAEVIVTKEGMINEKLVEPDDKGRQLNSHLSPVVGHESDQKEASQHLSCMIDRMIRESGNGPDPNDSKFSDSMLVENGDRPSDVKVNRRPTAKKMPSNEQMHTGLAALFKTRYTDARADEKNGMKNETRKGDRFSGSKMASTDVIGRRQDIIGFLDHVKELATVSQPRDIVDKSYQHIRDQRNKNGMGIMLESVKFINPDEDKKALCEPDICDDVKKLEQEEMWFEPLDSIVKDANGRESKSVDHSISCDETDQHDNNEESMKIHFEKYESQIECEDASGSDSDCAALDYPMESVTHISPPRNGLKPQTFLYTEKEKVQNKLMVNFLQKSVTENDIGAAFGDCGPIANIDIVPSRKENRFNYAYIYFKTKGGLQKAQTKTDMVIHGADVVVEATSPLLRIPVRMPPRCSFGNPTLLKNPSRTVMIKGLPHDLASHHLRNVLSVFGCISGFAMGSLNSIAYIEFATEDAKEKALAVSSIPMSGRMLSILRIDTPLTTVVRISNINSTAGQVEIHRICNSYGRVKRVVHRDPKTVDVHFMLTEWANMVKILNSLNGLVINQYKWLAQPATVIPVEILETLWSKPDGWRLFVRPLVQSLCRKIERDFINISELSDLVAEYYGEKA